VLVAMLVGKRMTVPVVTISPDEGLDTARELLRRHNFRHLPVTEGRRLVGIISESDLRIAEAVGRAGEAVVADAMITNLFTAAPETTVEQAAMLMVDNKISAVPVVNGDDEVIGILTASDILNVLLEVMGVGSGAARIEVMVPDHPGALAPVVRIIGDLGANIVSIVSPHAQNGLRAFIFRLATQDLEAVLTGLAREGIEVLSAEESAD
jgi:acetoin utilization protein AcuB